MNSYSQFGEDVVIASLFDTIGESNRWCFEVGAHDGRYFSNTLAFREQGWTAILAECHKEHGAKLMAEFGDKAFCVVDTITDIDRWLADTGAPADIDLGVIDVDGEDYWLWHDMVEFRPRVLMIEFNPYVTQPHYDADWPIPRGQVPGQTARQPIIDLACSRDYGLHAETFCNLVFVDSSLTMADSHDKV